MLYKIGEVYLRLLGTNGFHVKAEDGVVRTSNLKISRLRLADYLKKMLQRARRMCCMIICSIQTIILLICGVVVAVAVVFTQTPYSFSHRNGCSPCGAKPTIVHGDC